MTTLSPLPKRWLRLTSPYLHGEDVRVLQVGLDKRAKYYGEHTIDIDSIYGPATAALVARILYLMGAPSDKLDIGATTELQRFLRSPDSRPIDWISRAKQRQKAANTGRAAYLDYLYRYMGHAEDPKGMNHGPWLDPILREAGWNVPPSVKGPAYCGIGVLVGLRRAGLVVPNNWAYVPYIIRDCKAGMYGFKVVPVGERQPGDILPMDFGYSGDYGEHVGSVARDIDHTVEFNTSPGVDGNQQNGDGCYRRRWSERSGAVLMVIRPPWERAK